jgi:hypothetical protein
MLYERIFSDDFRVKTFEGGVEIRNAILSEKTDEI